MSQPRHPIKLYAISRKHNPANVTQIEETTFKLVRSDEPSPCITQQNAVRFVSWMFGWNFINIKDYPAISRSDVLGQIKDFIESNATSVIAGEEADNVMGEFVKEILNTFTNTVDSLSSTLLKLDEIPSIRLSIEMDMPPISVFELIKRLLYTDGVLEKITMRGNTEVEQLCMPRTSEDMLKQELEYFVHNNNEFRPYTKHLTTPYFVMYKMLKHDPNTPIEHVFAESMKRAHENTFHPNTRHKGVAILKAEIADYINSLEVAIQVPVGSGERDHHFEIIRKQLLRNMYDVYQLFLLYKNFDGLKTIDSLANLHLALDHIFNETGDLLLTSLQNPSIASSEYDKLITNPINTLMHNLQELHIQLCMYVQFKENKLGYPYGIVDIISANLFQIVLLLIAGIDQNTTTKLCIHMFGCVIVDLFFQRLITHIWDREPSICAYTNYIMSKYKPIQTKYKINKLSQLTRDNIKADSFQHELRQLIETEKLDASFFDFFLTFKFSPAERHAYNTESFARKIRSETMSAGDDTPLKPTIDINIQPHTFAKDLLFNLNAAIVNSQATLSVANSIYLYDRSIISAVFFSSGVEEFAKSFNGGSLYQNALSALLSDNRQDGN